MACIIATIGGKLHEDGNAADQNSSNIHGLLFGPAANEYESARFLTEFQTFQQFQFGMHSVELCCLNRLAMAFWRQRRARQVGLFSQPSAQDEEAAMASLDRFGIADFARHPFHELSGGEWQLAIFARALVSETEILILDEPTSSLDLKNQIPVLDWITRLSHQDGSTVLFTTHQIRHALAVADNALLMLGGTKFACGPANEVLSEENLHALYGVDIKLLLFLSTRENHTRPWCQCLPMQLVRGNRRCVQVLN